MVHFLINVLYLHLTNLRFIYFWIEKLWNAENSVGKSFCKAEQTSSNLREFEDKNENFMLENIALFKEEEKTLGLNEECIWWISVFPIIFQSFAQELYLENNAGIL